MKNNISFVLAFVAVALASQPAQAVDMAKAKKLLEDQQAHQCVMSSRTASDSEKAKAQQQYMKVSNEIGALSMEMMSDANAQVEFINLRSAIGNQPCTDAASKKDAKAAAGNAGKLVAELRKHLCAYNASNDWTVKPKHMLKADESRKKIKDASASMKSAGDVAGSRALDDAVRNLEMSPGSGC